MKPIRLTPVDEIDAEGRDFIDRHHIDRDTGELIDAETFIARSTWTFARSMPGIPHEYTVKGRTALSDGSFDWFAGLTRQLGERRTFGRRVFAYLVVGEWEYWVMSPPGIATVINRQRLVDRPERTGAVR